MEYNMKTTSAALALLFLVSPALAQETRQLGAHEHGVGHLDIAIESGRIAGMLEVPGADIVGFEHEATSEEDRAAIEDALASLESPLDLFELPASAGCTMEMAQAGLLGGTHEHAEDHEADHAEHEADHEEHVAEEDHAGHEHDEAHGEDHDHEGVDHAEHDGDEAAEDHEHEGGQQHSEFEASFTLLCESVTEISEVGFPYFKTFRNARELQIRIVSAMGAQSASVTREAPSLELGGDL